MASVKKPIKIYKDKYLTEEIVENDIYLGIVPAGEVREFKFWILNDSVAHIIDFKVIVDHEEVEVVEAPKTLTSKAVGELIIKWSASVDLEEGLHIPFRFKGKAQVG